MKNSQKEKRCHFCERLHRGKCAKHTVGTLVRISAIITPFPVEMLTTYARNGRERRQESTQNLEVKRVTEEGNIVAVHSHVKQKQDDLGGAEVHIFRFHNDLIVELWDVGQPIPENFPNENGVF